MSTLFINGKIKDISKFVFFISNQKILEEKI